MVRPARPEDVPETLRELRRWVLWRWVRIGVRWTKIPYTLTGQKASTADPATWSEFEDAWSAMLRSPEWGLGFVIAAGDGITGIDLDKCLNADGSLKEWAQPVVEKLAFTYMEISPSQTGLKAFVAADLAAIRGCPNGCRGRLGDGEVEVYGQGRFFTVTGIPFNDAPPEIEENSPAVRWLLRKLGKLKPRHPVIDIPPATAWGSLSAEEQERIRTILHVARENVGDAKFRDLIDGGAAYYPGADGEPDDSRADAGFYYVLSLLFDRDPAKMYAAFMMTARGTRMKARRPDYHERTIRSVLRANGRAA
jgi:primase-polymerase (primpol)-like protein